MRERYQLHDEFVLYAGNVKPHKNLERLIEAFHLVRNRGPRSPQAGADRRRHLEVRGAPARGPPPPAPQVRPVPRLPAGGDAGGHVPAGGRVRVPVALRGLRPAAARGDGERHAGRHVERLVAARGGRRRGGARRSLRSGRDRRRHLPRADRRSAAARACGEGARARAAVLVGRRRCGACGRSTARSPNGRRGRARGATRTRARKPRRERVGAKDRPRPRLADRHARAAKGARGAVRALPDGRALHARPRARLACRRSSSAGRFTRRSSSSCRWCRGYYRQLPAALSRSPSSGSDFEPVRPRPERQPLLREVGDRGRRGARHLCYCLTPMRYAWDQFDAYFGPDRHRAAAQPADAAGDGPAGAVGSRHGRPRGPLCGYLSLCCGEDPPIL